DRRGELCSREHSAGGRLWGRPDSAARQPAPLVVGKSRRATIRAMATVPRPERPAFLPGYGLQSRAHDTTTFAWADAEQHLNRSRTYWIVSVRASGRPHAMPVWGVWLDGALQFSTD